MNGLTLRVREAGPEGGPLLILLHGFPESSFGWRRQVGPFAEAGYRVVAPDMRGYGGSDAPPSVADYHLDLLAADIVGLADRYGAGRFDLVGHDWGGIVAWAVAAWHPDLVRCLVVMDAPHPDTFTAAMIRHPTQALRSAYVGFFQIPAVPEAVLSAKGYAGLRAAIGRTARPAAVSEAELDRYAEDWARPGRLTAMLNYYRALPRRPTIGRIGVPTLVLWGEEDAALERHLAEAAVGQCDEARLEVIPDTTHWIHLEEPGRVNALVLGHLGAEGRG
ncbi:alpha/beta fold hydrolase [Roseomonas sp. CCTCC AB2023176]|uniref:alpha/beta fold hydrolase n=1 Tax=Roseomonas sp. CCTCC AB2023176 TaxID=3342640 RepID=UPI0035E0E211